MDTPATDAVAAEAPATPETQTVETPAPVSAAALMEAKLEALRLKNAERKARTAKLDERAKEVETREKTVAGWKDDPRAALLATGLSPKDALDELVRQAELDGTPQGEISKMEKAFRAELAAHKAELDALRAERDAERAAKAEREQATKQAEAERAFVSTTLAADKYAPLRATQPDGTPVYTEAELVNLGNHFAEQLSAGGKGTTLEAVADAMLAEHLKWASRFGPTPAAPPAPAPAGKTVNGGRQAPNTLSNKASESAPTGPLSFEEKLERAKKKFASAG